MVIRSISPDSIHAIVACRVHVLHVSEQNYPLLPILFRLASAEDTIVAKLMWYRAMGGSTRQWADIISVISNQQPGLDLGYLRSWADTLGVRTDLERALTDARAGKP